MKWLRVLIIRTYSPEYITAETKEGMNPLLDILRIMRRESLLKELALRNLDTEETKQVIEEMLKGPIYGELLQKVVCESGGNPLYS